MEVDSKVWWLRCPGFGIPPSCQAETPKILRKGWVVIKLPRMELEGFDRGDGAPGAGSGWVLGGAGGTPGWSQNVPTQMIPFSLSWGLEQSLEKAGLRFCRWLTQGGPGGLGRSVPPRTGTPWEQWPAQVPAGALDQLLLPRGDPRLHLCVSALVAQFQPSSAHPFHGSTSHHQNSVTVWGGGGERTWVTQERRDFSALGSVGS